MTRGHQQGIATRHGQVGERLGIADMDTDLSREALLKLSELPFQVTITAPDHHELGPRCDESLCRIYDHIETFLPVQSTDNDEDGSCVVIRERKMLTKSRLADDFARQVVLIISGGKIRIVTRVPRPVVNPIENAN